MTPPDAQPPEVGTLTLVDFLLARLAEDEAVARLATGERWRVNAEGSEGSRIAPDVEDKRERSRFLGILNGRVQPEDGRNARHIVRHDPARVLAEVSAKRRIVELHNQWDDASGEQYPPAYWDAPVDEILYALASVYSDHPDWREEWRA